VGDKVCLPENIKAVKNEAKNTALAGSEGNVN